MSGPVRDEPRAPEGLRQRSGTVHVAVKSVTESKAFTVRGSCTVRQLKWGLAERLGVPAELLVLVHCGRVLKESELLSHLRAKDESVSLRLMLSSQHPSAALTCDPASEMVQSELTATLDPDSESAAPSSTSPLCLVEGPDSLGLTNNRPGFLSALQRQMGNQLLDDPEMTRRLLGTPYMQSTLSTSSPQRISQLILPIPQIQQLRQTNPEVGDMLDNTDVITQVMERIKNPDMIEEVMHNEDRTLDNLHPEQQNHDGFLKADTKSLNLSQIQIGASTMEATSSGTQQPTDRESNESPPVSSRSDPLNDLTTTPRADPNPQSSVTAAMQLLLQEITSTPGLMESLLSGPHVSSLLQCLSQNLDLAAQMLLSHPLFSGNPQLQQQMRQQIPLFLQQMQSPELLSAMLNPRAIEALLHIQQGLQTLAAEVPALIPTASINAAPEQASDSVLNTQSGSGRHVAMVTEQQQQFVQQMLQALANTNHRVHVEEFQDELDHLSSMGFRDREVNLQVLMSTGGDLTTAIQHLLRL